MHNQKRAHSIPRYLRWTALSVISGILAGAAVAVFLILLEWVTDFRNAHMGIVWALPFAGFFIGWVYHRYGTEVMGGHNLILDEIHDPKKVIPIKMAPFVLIGTIVTHLFGGSAGREGTAIQMGAALSDQLTKLFKIEPMERKILLVAGTGAGFGAAIGAPWAGVVFGMEVIHIGRLRPFAWFECVIASFVGYYTAVVMGAHHAVFPRFAVPDLQLKTVLCVILAGVIFGQAAKVFTLATHFVEEVSARWIKYPPLRPFLAGAVLVTLYYLESTYRYVGLGIPGIQESFNRNSGFEEPVLKAIFTAITVGSGFKGGEFIPLVFIGTTLGSALSVILPVSFQLLAGLGFAAVFAGAANTPIACSLMAIELFGYKLAPYAFLACFMSYWASGNRGIYRGQKGVKRL